MMRRAAPLPQIWLGFTPVISPPLLPLHPFIPHVGNSLTANGPSIQEVPNDPPGMVHFLPIP